MSESVTRRPSPGHREPRGRIASVIGLVLLGVACAGFVALGNWQVRRLAWKEGLIRDVATRVHAVPVTAPGPSQWPKVVAGELQYLHVAVHGRFIDRPPTLVHGTSSQGYGFWVMAPLQTTDGFIVLVNRGYVPADLPEAAPGTAALAPPRGELTLRGLLRFSEPGGGVLRRNHPAQGRWYSRDVAAIAAAQNLPSSRVAPYFVDADTRPGGPALPLAGQTVIHFPNHHLGYAITWYLMALGCVVAGVLAWRRRNL